MTKKEQLSRAPRVKKEMPKKKRGLRTTKSRTSRTNKKKATQKRKPILMPLTKLDNLVWKITSLAFRLQDSDRQGFVKCCTCGNKMYYYKSDAQLGHFKSRSAKWTKFLRKNLSTQDTKCNKYGAGEQFKFGKFLDRTYGAGTAEAMMTYANKPEKFGRYEYKKHLLENSRILLDEAKSRRLYDWKSGMAKWELDFLEKLDDYNIDEKIIIHKQRV